MIGREQEVALRFSSIGLHPTSTIVSAYIQFTSYSSQSASYIASDQFVDIAIHAEDVANSNAITSASGSVSSRAKTNTAVLWSPLKWAISVSTADQKTPDLASVMQDVVSRGDWALDNAMTILFVKNNTANDSRFAFNSVGSTTLSITYWGLILMIFIHRCEFDAC